MRVVWMCSVFLPRVRRRFSLIQSSRSWIESQPTQSLMRCSVTRAQLLLQCGDMLAPPADVASNRLRLSSGNELLRRRRRAAGGRVEIDRRLLLGLLVLLGRPRAAACAAGAEPVVSGWAAGSAVMMLTGGIESDDGKNSSAPDPGGRGDAGRCESRRALRQRLRRQRRGSRPAQRSRSVPAPAPARPRNAARRRNRRCAARGWRSHGCASRISANAGHCSAVQPSRVASTWATRP